MECMGVCVVSAAIKRVATGYIGKRSLLVNEWDKSYKMLYGI